MTRALILIIAICFTLKLNAQTLLLERDLSESVYVKKKGPNKDHFLHIYSDLSGYIPLNGDRVYEPGRSFRYYTGLRNYYRLAGNYIMGFNLEFGWENFRIDQSNAKIFPAPGTHKKETLVTSNLGLEYFNRILITQKETSLGIWIDAGAYGNLTLGSRHVAKDKAAATDQIRYSKTVEKGLKYLNPWEFGVKGRIGYKRYAITGTYRLTDWVKGVSSNYEPSKFSIGVELGLY